MTRLPEHSQNGSPLDVGDPDDPETEEGIDPEAHGPVAPDDYPADISKFEVDVREIHLSSTFLKAKASSERLVLAPSFQRGRVWDRRRMSRFIESMILNIPLPPIFLNQRRDGAYLVVDGRQRLSTVFDYLDGYFALEPKSLGRLTWLEGSEFGNLDPQLQARIEDCNFHIHLLKPSVPMRVVFDIFQRINSGGVHLNRQEIRNGLYNGEGTELLAQLAADLRFNAATGGVSSKRMKDAELALRCIFALEMTAGEATSYAGDMDDTLNRKLESLNRRTPAQRAELAERFLAGMQTTADLFGSAGFRLPSEKTRGAVNLSVAEAVFGWVVEQDPGVLAGNRKRIVANHSKLVRNDEFLVAVRFATSDAARVRARRRLAAQILGA